MKILFLLTTLTLLASCTKAPAVVSPAPEAKVIQESKTMPEDATMQPEGAKPETMMKDEMKDTMMMSGEMMDHSGMEMKPQDEVMMKPTGYMNYDEMKVKEALVSGQKVALFFHATWCPTCKALEKSINAELSSIPSDTLIVKVDYDSATEIKQKYGVTAQHTTILIDRDMNLISKKLGARNIGEVLN